MSAKNFMSYGDAETVFTAMANAIKNNEDAVAAVTSALAAIKDGTDIDSFGDVEVALLDKADTSDLGTAAAKDSTNSVTAGSTDLVESGAVREAIDTAVASAYHHAGTKTVAQLTHDLLIAANEGNVYNITDSGTTTSDFIEGIGKQIDAGDNVGICKVGNVYMFDLLSGLEDTSGFVRKSQTSGLLKNDGTVNTTIEDTVAGHTTAINGKQDKYETITYAEWQAMTPEQQAAKDYYISDYPSSVLTAGNIAYDNTSSGMAANKVQGAIDELHGDVTDVKGITDYFIDLAVGESVVIGGNHMGIVAWLGWNGLQARGEAALDPRVLIRPSNTYSFAIDGAVNMVLPTTGDSVNAASIVSSVTIGSSGEVEFDFSSDPFGTANDVVVLIKTKIIMTRTA